MAENKLLEMEPGKAAIRIPVVTQGVVWLAVVANLQLALSHPQNKSATADMAREFAEQVLNKLEQESVIGHEVSEALFRGFVSGAEENMSQELGSTMVIEFSERKDVAQALLEGMVDLTMVGEHLASAARRMEVNFPAIAEVMQNASKTVLEAARTLDQTAQRVRNERVQ